MDLQANMLGPVVVDRLGERVFLDRPAQRRLLSVLVLAGGGRVSTDALIDRFWDGEPPETARAAIHTHVSALRRDLGDGVVVTEGYGYRFNLEDNRVDVDEFTRLADETKKHAGGRDWELALQNVEAALGLWRGDPYPELVDDEFARSEITRLTELHVEMLETRAEALIGLGRAEQVLPDLEALVLEHPLRERLWEHLMTARYRLGRNTEALRAFQEVSDHLAEIGVEPSEPLQRLEEKILLHDPSLTRTQHNLPVELDSFIGRTTEIEEITKLLADNRMVTLTGAGGSGKTRLATHTAAQLLDNYPDGIYYVELAALTDPNLIAPEIAQTVGVQPTDNNLTDTITRRIGTDQTLIILDNCEHLIEETSRIARKILESCSELTVLATSRSPLRVPGEFSYNVPGLSNSSGVTDPTEGLEYDAIRLFSDRASASGSFILTERNLNHVIDICARLDGMPLAIELAAVRTSNLTAETIAGRLDDRFRLLTGGQRTGLPKHQTLEAAIDWSYQLLDPREQTTLTRLSVFRGGFDLEMAERVASGLDLDPEGIVPTVAALADKSLVVSYDWEQGRRYRLLETIREFASQRLDETGHVALARQCHCEWAVEFCDLFVQGLSGGGRSQRMARIHREIDNLMVALDWSEQNGDQDATSMVLSAVAWHWGDLGYLTRYYDTLFRARELCNDPVRRAEIEVFMSYAAWTINLSEEAWILARDAYHFLREQPVSPASVLAAARFSSLHWILVDRNAEDGIPAGREAVQWAEELDNIFLQIRARGDFATVLVSSGLEDEGLQELEHMLDLVERAGDSDFALSHYHSAITTLMTVRSARRRRPREIVDLMLRVAESDAQMTQHAADWTAFVYMQTGEFEKSAEILRRDAQSEHLEAMDELSMRIPRASLLWMQGNLDLATEDIRSCEHIGVNPRWYHDFLAVKAEIATDLGAIEDVRESAAFYLALDVASSEAVKKLGTLHPLVRAEVEASLKGGPESPDRHAKLARASLATMKQIRFDSPPPSTGSYMAETHDTHLTFATAEVSRLEQSDPELWRKAQQEADYIYYRLYAQWRLAEALLQNGRQEEGAHELGNPSSSNRPAATPESPWPWWRR
jgi:predicted ATPase/DNA-binding SARP family transcriptional activator